MDNSKRSRKIAKPMSQRGCRRPKGLRGKDIGLFYRDVRRARNAEEAAQIAETYAKKVSEYKGTTIKERREDRFLRKQQKTNPVSI